MRGWGSGERVTITCGPGFGLGSGTSEARNSVGAWVGVRARAGVRARSGVMVFD